MHKSPNNYGRILQLSQFLPEKNIQRVKRLKAPRTFLLSANVFASTALSYWMDLVSAIRIASAQSAVESHVLTTAPARRTPISATLWKLVRPKHRHRIVAFAAVTFKIPGPNRMHLGDKSFSCCFLPDLLLWVARLLDMI